MELTGDLSDFALSDILQILALSRKTGTLSLENGSVSGRIIIEAGVITYARVQPGESLAEGLVSEGVLRREHVEVLRSVGASGRGVWTLESLLEESGLIKGKELARLARRHIKRAVSRLIMLEKGRFGISLNEVSVVSEVDDMRLSEGLDVGEVLLEAAKERDELRRNEQVRQVNSNGNGHVAKQVAPPTYPESDNASEVMLPGKAGGVAARNGGGHNLSEGNKASADKVVADSDGGRRTELLCSLLAELRSHTFEVEVSLSAMRYASEVATRGVLFMVEEGRLRGLGQFGVQRQSQGSSADEVVRGLDIPISQESTLGAAAASGLPHVGELRQSYWDSEFLTRLGNVIDGLEVFVLPLTCKGRTVFVLYGDNYPGGRPMQGIEELMVFMSQAGVILEKIALEREVQNTQL